jgi:hypothetical protein
MCRAPQVVDTVVYMVMHLPGHGHVHPFPQGLQQGVDELCRRGINDTPTEQRLKNLRDVMKSNPGSLFAPQVMNELEIWAVCLLKLIQMQLLWVG